MKNSTRDIIFGIGLLLMLIDVFVIDGIYQKGMLINPRWVNFATLIYDLGYWFGLLFIGIVGLVMVIISAKYYRD